MPFSPAQVHAQQHLGPVGGVDAAGFGPDGDQRLARVVLAGQQGAHLELVDAVPQRPELALDLGPRLRVVLRLAELPEHLGVVDPPTKVLDPTDLALHVGQPAGYPLRALLVVPQVGDGRLLLESGDLAAQLVEVEDGLDAGERAGELLQLGRHVSHMRTRYA